MGQNPVIELQLAHERYLFHPTVPVNYVACVIVAAEACALPQRIVYNNQIQMLFIEFPFAAIDLIVGFQSEPDNQPAPLIGRKVTYYVGCSNKIEIEIALPPDLAFGNLLRSVVTYGRSHYEAV